MTRIETARGRQFKSARPDQLLPLRLFSSLTSSASNCRPTKHPNLKFAAANYTKSDCESARGGRNSSPSLRSGSGFRLRARTPAKRLKFKSAGLVSGQALDREAVLEVLASQGPIQSSFAEQGAGQAARKVRRLRGHAGSKVQPLREPESFSTHESPGPLHANLQLVPAHGG